MEIPNPDARASPFSFASQKKVEALLRDTGFVDVQLESFETKAVMGEGSLEECVDYIAKFVSSVAAVLRDRSDAEGSEVVNTLHAVLAPYHSGSSIELAASAWIVSARRH
jgi:hypothetical protein